MCHVPRGRRSAAPGASARYGWAALAALLLNACALPTATAPDETRAAWVQADADGAWSARAITAAASCPTLAWEGGSNPMQVRAGLATVPARAKGGQPLSKAAEFPVLSCEAHIPAGVRSLHIGATSLPAPPVQARRIVLVGDSGCRMKASEDAWQDCNDAGSWPFATVARSAALMHPDLVIHVGDLHYRESPCPASRAGCAGSPWGYGWDVWQADLFRPAAPLLAAAPWVFVRGNHESCSRAGVGWLRFLDAHAWSATRSCEDPANDGESDFGRPFAVPLDADWQLIVFDSAAISSHRYRPGDPALVRYVEDTVEVDRLAEQKPHSIWASHHPALGFGVSQDGHPKPGHAGLQSVLAVRHPQRLFTDGVDLTIQGHVHLFEAIGFAGDEPATLVVGNSGSQMEGHLDAAAALAARPEPDAAVDAFATQLGFGFAMLERSAGGWRLTEFDVAGRPLRHCSIEGRKLECGLPMSKSRE